MNFLVLIHRINVLIYKILSLCYTPCKVNSSTTQNKVSEPLLIFAWFFSMCSVLFLYVCLKLPTSFKQDSWYLIPFHKVNVVKMRIVFNMNFFHTYLFSYEFFGLRRPNVSIACHLSIHYQLVSWIIVELNILIYWQWSKCLWSNSHQSHAFHIQVHDQIHERRDSHCSSPLQTNWSIIPKDRAP